MKKLSTNRLTFQLLLGVIGFIGVANLSFAEPQVISAECTTEGTDRDGSRNSCDSDVTRLEAPENHVFSKETLTGGETSGNGSEHECRIAFDKNVEILPRIYQPSVVTLQAHARSPGGMTHGGERGWAKCKYTVEAAKYK